MHKYLLIAGVAALSFAQTSPQFEVASIKPADPNERRMRISIAPGGRFEANGITVRFLIQQAYGIKDFQISGGPSWMGTERYDVSAKAEGDTNPTGEQLRPMLQAMLADRFKLTIHRETKEMPIYALVVGKNGPKMQESEFQGPPPGTGPPPNAAGGGPGGAPGGAGGRGGMMRMGRGQLSATGVTVTFLANQLSNQLGRNVIDKTGLTKNYDFKLEFSPEGQPMLGGGPGPGPGGEEPHPVDPNSPSIFTAVQDQLGLKLEAQKGPVEILIIDRIEKATAN